VAARAAELDRELPYRLIANLAAERPLLVLVDDLHWADAPSLRWLVHLAPRLEGLPVALVLAARPLTGGREEQLVDRLASDRSVRVLRPAELSETAGDLAAWPGVTSA
jgi:hypothetical protein